MLVPLPQPARQPAVHHIPGRVVQHQRGDAPPPALLRRPDALGVHPRLDHGKVDFLRPQIGGIRPRLQHGEPPAHHGKGRQAVNFDAVFVGFPRGQPRQRRRYDQRPMPRRGEPPRQIPCIALDPAGCGQVLRREKTDGHTSRISCSFSGGKWVCPQYGCQSASAGSLVWTSKANSVTGLSRQTGWVSVDS